MGNYKNEYLEAVVNIPIEQKVKLLVSASNDLLEQGRIIFEKPEEETITLILTTIKCISTWATQCDNRINLIEGGLINNFLQCLQVGTTVDQWCNSNYEADKQMALTVLAGIKLRCKEKMDICIEFLSKYLLIFSVFATADFKYSSAECAEIDDIVRIINTMDVQF